MASNPTTRRTLLAAMALVPAAVAVPAQAIAPSAFSLASTNKWDALFVKWERASARYLAATTNEEETELGDAETKLWRQLMVMPAPNADALLWKMTYLWGEGNSDGSCDSWTMDIVHPVLRDAHRMLGGKA